jgi:hypothetical protein
MSEPRLGGCVSVNELQHVLQSKGSCLNKTLMEGREGWLVNAVQADLANS